MFGYVLPNKGELKVRELEEYQGWYCGLCRRLQKEYGFSGRLSLNYDMTFLAMILSSLYDVDKKVTYGGCVAHPIRKRYKYDTMYVSYAASMNILLTYYKCMDDWQDDRNLIRGTYGVVLHQAGRRVSGQYPDQSEMIRQCLEELKQAELRNEADLDLVSGLFGRICGALFAPEKDIWYQDLCHMGFYLGKYIYLLDAWDDLQKDFHTKSYNPFLAADRQIQDIEMEKDNRKERVRQILTEMISRACYHFERLPVVDNVEILRNILYSGVWTKFDQKKSRTDKKEWREEG